MTRPRRIPPTRPQRKFPRAVGASGASAEDGRPEQFFNRELSWLDFNARVLDQARDAALPLLERLRFIAIFGHNLDEFFMQRIGGLQQRLASYVRRLSPDGRTPRRQLEEIQARVRPLVAEQHRLFLDELVPALRSAGFSLLRWPDLSVSQRDWAREFFAASVYPILTPIALDPAHPLPYVSNLSLSLAVALRHPKTGERRFGRVKVPESLARWVRLPGVAQFLPIEDLIAEHLERLFPGTEATEAHAFRVTRGADLQIDDDTADDLLDAIEEELRELRFARVVRLQVVPEMPAWMRRLLREELGVEEEDVFEVPSPLGLAGLMPLCESHGPEAAPLRHAPWRPVTPPRLAAVAEGEPDAFFRALSERDLLLHHPYDAFSGSVQRFIQTAARDPQVLAIKQTLYRTQPNSPIVQSLIEAAESGKQVAVIVELKARFDEARNIEWARRLEEAGAHVAYGVVGLKTHAKVALVVRQERGELRSYVHFGTGNYNAETAVHYTDLGLFSTRADLARDAAQLFNLLTGFVVEPRFEKLLVAPSNMRLRYGELIEREIEHRRAGRPARLLATMNSLEDPEMVRLLYRASTEGVAIDLVVRGICRLRPGIAGLSERIRVVSIVGRFLEHARIFWFENGGEPAAYLGSADWMARNLNGRVEVVVPVEDGGLREELRTVLEMQLEDNCDAWDLNAAGAWTRRRPSADEERRSSQERLMDRALRRTAGAAGDAGA